MNRLKELRKEAGLNQTELASRLGIVQSTLSHWEQGKYDIDNESLLKLAEMFDCTTDYILGRTHHPQVEYIPADPTAVAEHEAWMLQERDKNRESMRQALNGMAQQKNPAALSDKGEWVAQQYEKVGPETQKAIDAILRSAIKEE